MAWGKVDDKLHSSVKWRRASKGARSLWTTALSWCSDQENDGVIPADMLRTLDGTKAEAASLVAAGLWDVADDGWAFHDWQDYNPDGASKKAKREAESLGGKQGNHTRWHASKGIRVPGCEFCDTTSGTRSGGDRRPESGANPPDPPRPDPSRPDSDTHLSSSATTRNARERDEPETHPEFDSKKLLASSGLAQHEVRDFLLDLKGNGARNTTAIVNSLHRKGLLTGRITEWRDERALGHEASTRPPVTRVTPTRARLLAEMADAQHATQNPQKQIGA